MKNGFYWVKLVDHPAGWTVAQVRDGTWWFIGCEFSSVAPAIIGPRIDEPEAAL